MILRISIVSLLLSFGHILVAATPNAGCPECLTREISVHVLLSSEQRRAVSAVNAAFLYRREQLARNTDAIGYHTALLICWDDWRMALAGILSEEQMMEFNDWQSGEDLLAPGLYLYDR